MKIAFLGDVVGSVGRTAFARAVPVLRREMGAAVVIVNAENSKHGSGLSPDNYREIRRAGADAVTLGDHAFKDRAVLPLLADAGEPIARPANLSLEAPGKRLIRIPPPAGRETPGTPVYVLTVLGRLFMPIPADNPFNAIDREIGGIQEAGAVVIVEVHGEATSEKQAVAWHCVERWTGQDAARPRVVAVVGSHTHVQTSDARILDHAVAAITDLGMCGPHRSVIGRSIDATLSAMRTQNPTPLDVATDEPRACGALIRIDEADRRAVGIELVSLPG